MEEVYSVKRSTDKCHVGKVSMEQVHSGEQSQVYNVTVYSVQCTVYRVKTEATSGQFTVDSLQWILG